jgi:iron(III) transport system ATP-binding protein
MLQIDHLVKTFEGGRDAEPVHAVDDVSFQVEEGQLYTLLGPSGCGKTTTLRSIAGLEQPDQGTIRLGDWVLFSRGQGASVNVPANQRGLGMVFQSYAIWPHMRVFDNVAFPLQVRRRRWSWTTWPTGRRPSCPAASSSGWPWPGPWSPSRR